ncbi:MAG: GntR family transcriptional regulator [Oscillospiraceae bacterium]|nr:GntR family transcriptional regulator [Oscillospiraceae bacterium]
MIKYEFDNDIPIYVQIMNIIKLEIVSNKIVPGQKLLSIREISEEFGVTPNTVQKSLMKLEEQGLIFTERTNGKFVTQDVELIKTTRQKIAREKIDCFIKDMKEIGYDISEIKNLI